MKLGALEWLVLVAAALSPLARRAPAREPSRTDAPELPTQIEGRALVPVVAGEIEASFLASFPGRIGRFDDGERTWILRSVATPTLSLHSSSRCLEAAGFEIHTLPAHRDARGHVWSRVSATRAGRTFVVRERVTSLASGVSWPDVDTWRFDAWLGRDAGPWLAASAIERAARGDDGGKSERDD